LAIGYLRDGYPTRRLAVYGNTDRKGRREHVRRFRRRSVVRVALDALSFPMGEPKIDPEIEELIEDDAKAEQSPSNRGRWLTTRAPRAGARWSEAGRPLGAPDRGVKSIIRRSRAARSRARAGARSPFSENAPPTIGHLAIEPPRDHAKAHFPCLYRPNPSLSVVWAMILDLARTMRNRPRRFPLGPLQ
jgi:hypothetical protein